MVIQSENDSDDSNNEMLQVGAAAKLLGVSISTLRNWDKAGKLKAARHPMNGYRVYGKAELKQLVAEIRREYGSNSTNA